MARSPYSTGCKSFLANIKIGVEVEVPEALKYYSIKSVATRISKDYGCRFTFYKREGKKYVKRLS